MACLEGKLVFLALVLADNTGIPVAKQSHQVVSQVDTLVFPASVAFQRHWASVLVDMLVSQALQEHLVVV